MTPGGGINITLLTYSGIANIGLVCCSKKIKDLQPLHRYVEEAFNLLEKSVDDPSVSIRYMGEHQEDMPVSIVSETLSDQENQNLSR